MSPKYSSLNQALHWLTAACMFAILPLAWVMTNMKPNAAYRGDLFNWHKTLGLIVLLVTAFRIVWRFVDGPPAYPPRVAVWERRAAHAAYWIFFLLLIWMPLTGFLASYLGGHPIKLFDVVPTPDFLPQDKARSEFFDNLHLAGQWGIYALIVLHLAAVTMHVVWRKTGLLGRMLPTYAAVPKDAASAPARRRSEEFRGTEYLSPCRTFVGAGDPRDRCPVPETPPGRGDDLGSSHGFAKVPNG